MVSESSSSASSSSSAPETPSTVPHPEAAVALHQAAPAEDLLEDVREGVLEVPVGHDVDEGVQGGVEVSDPEEYRHHDVRTRAVGVAADGHSEVPGEERQPAEQEGPHDDAQGDEGLVLLAPGGVDAVALAEPCGRRKGEISEIWLACA